MKQIEAEDLWCYGPYGYTVMRWSLRGKWYQLKESSMRWRSLVFSGLRMGELEDMEGTMGHFLGLITLYLCCTAVHHYG